MDQVKGSITVAADDDGIKITASDGVPTSLIIQVVDSYSLTRRNRHKEIAEQQRSRKLGDVVQSVFALALLLFAFGFIGQMAGCGQESPYQNSQWGSAR